MKGSRAAVRYAKAVLDLAKDRNVTKEVNDDMVLITETMDSSGELRTFLGSPVIKDEIKRNALNDIFKNVNGLTSEMFNLLLENNRIDILFQVASKYKDQYNAMNGVQVARVTTAFPLTPALEAKVQQKVKQLTGNEAKIQNIIDESIIGGFVLRVGDIQYNGSVKHQLTSLGRELKNNTYVSKI